MWILLSNELPSDPSYNQMQDLEERPDSPSVSGVMEAFILRSDVHSTSRSREFLDVACNEREIQFAE
jgi:hypothetical protein